jgi:hypothetical protein
MLIECRQPDYSWADLAMALKVARQTCGDTPGNVLGANYGSEGWGFESLRARKKALVMSLTGAS